MKYIGETKSELIIAISNNELGILSKGLLNAIEMMSRADDREQDKTLEKEFRTRVGGSREFSKKLIDQIAAIVQDQNTLKP